MEKRLLSIFALCFVLFGVAFVSADVCKASNGYYYDCNYLYTGHYNYNDLYVDHSYNYNRINSNSYSNYNYDHNNYNGNYYDCNSVDGHYSYDRCRYSNIMFIGSKYDDRISDDYYYKHTYDRYQKDDYTIYLNSGYNSNYGYPQIKSITYYDKSYNKYNYDNKIYLDSHSKQNLYNTRTTSYNEGYHYTY